MSVYLISEVDIHDPVEYQEYRKLVPASLAKYGGKFIVRGGKTEVLEGNWSPKRLVVCEFESMQKAQEWYHSPEYAPAMKIRKKTSKANIILVESV